MTIHPMIEFILSHKKPKKKKKFIEPYVKPVPIEEPEPEPEPIKVIKPPRPSKSKILRKRNQIKKDLMKLAEKAENFRKYLIEYYHNENREVNAQR
jgi:hypothetical protein